VIKEENYFACGWRIMCTRDVGFQIERNNEGPRRRLQMERELDSSVMAKVRVR
jgi:hypothetical protein